MRQRALFAPVSILLTVRSGCGEDRRLASTSGPMKVAAATVSTPCLS